MALSTACRLAALAFLATAGAKTFLIETKGGAGGADYMDSKEATQFANMKGGHPAGGLGADYMDSKEATQFANMKGGQPAGGLGADYMDSKEAANWAQSRKECIRACMRHIDAIRQGFYFACEPECDSLHATAQGRK
jgi:hypothetical protein